jgi:hypothetical protein
MLARWPTASRCRQHAREMTSLAVPSACSRGDQQLRGVPAHHRSSTLAAPQLPGKLDRALEGVGGTRRGGKRFALVTTPSRTRVGPRTTWLRQRLDAHAAVLGLRRPRSLDHASFFFARWTGVRGLVLDLQAPRRRGVARRQDRGRATLTVSRGPRRASRRFGAEVRLVRASTRARSRPVRHRDPTLQRSGRRRRRRLAA